MVDNWKKKKKKKKIKVETWKQRDQRLKKE
jgi:hypothetical protein